LPPNARKNSLEPNGWLLTVERSVMGSRQASRAALRVEQGGCKGEPDKAACSSVGSGTQGFCNFHYKQKPGVELNYTRLSLFIAGAERRQYNKVKPKPDATRRRAK